MSVAESLTIKLEREKYSESRERRSEKRSRIYYVNKIFSPFASRNSIKMTSQ